MVLFPIIKIFCALSIRFVYLNMVEANNRVSGLLDFVMQANRHLERCHVMNVSQSSDHVIVPFALLREGLEWAQHSEPARQLPIC